MRTVLHVKLENLASEEWWDPFTKLHCPSTYLLMYWTWKKSKVSKHKVKNMYILLNTQQKIFYSKKRCEPSQTIQLQINNHSYIKNWDKRGGREHFFMPDHRHNLSRPNHHEEVTKRKVFDNERSGMKNVVSTPQQQVSQLI